MNLLDFKDKHNGEACIICGLGPSLNDLPDNFKDEFWTIGVNDICNPEKGFTVDYLVMSENPMRRFKEKYLNKKQCIILNSKPKEAIFSVYKGRFKHKRPVIVQMIDLRENKDIQDIHNQNKLFAIRKITTAAISLAIYMGFSLIGVIGHDCQGERAFYDWPNSLFMHGNRIAEMNEYMKMIFLFCRRNKIGLYNLSRRSAFNAFPSISFDKFYKLTEKLYEKN